jgi:hypothetical protein
MCTGEVSQQVPAVADGPGAVGPEAPTSSVRVFVPVLSSASETCFRIVSLAIPSASAIWPFVSPFTSGLRTSSLALSHIGYDSF